MSIHKSVPIPCALVVAIIAASLASAIHAQEFVGPPAPQPIDYVTSAPAEEPIPPPIQPDVLEQLETAFTSVVDRVAPSVVAIRADRRPIGRNDSNAATADLQTSTGSGVVLRPNGLILTSQHVIENAASIHVTLHDGRRFRARRVAGDPRADLAVIRVEADGLATAELVDVAQLRRGQIVLAFGNPLNLARDGQSAVSQGVISAIGRPLPESFGMEEDRYYGDMIHTSAQILPGHSGGPLVDIRGRVIGILTVAADPQSLAAVSNDAPIGFAVPINGRTRSVIDKLLAGDEVLYGYAGVRVGNPPPSASAAGGTMRGALLDKVFANGPAQRGGLRSGDVVTSVSADTTSQATRQMVENADDFVRIIGAAGPEREVEIEFLRNGARHTALMILARRPSTEETIEPMPAIQFRGAQLEGVPDPMRAASALPDRSLIVIQVEDGSPADRAGLTPGDIVVRVEGRPLGRDAAEAMASLTGDTLVGLANGGSVLIRAK